MDQLTQRSHGAVQSSPNLSDLMKEKQRYYTYKASWTEPIMENLQRNEVSVARVRCGNSYTPLNAARPACAAHLS
jgi:hypothetical protein